MRAPVRRRPDRENYLHLGHTYRNSGGKTITTIAAVEQGLPEYDPDRIHHFRLTRDAVEEVFRTLATESAAQRAHNPGLEAGRVDVIVGGAAVLVGIFRVLGFDEMLVSEADILDGLARSLVG